MQTEKVSLKFSQVNKNMLTKSKNDRHLKRKNVPSTLMEMVMTTYQIEVGGKYGKFNERFLCLETWRGLLTMRDMELDDKTRVMRV